MFVFVLAHNKKPLSPCHPARARKLLSGGKAAVFRRYPFTIILKEEKEKVKTQPLRLKIDPGSRTTGLAILQRDRVIWAAELAHRGLTIKKLLAARRALRRGRRSRKTRYRRPPLHYWFRKANSMPESKYKRSRLEVQSFHHVLGCRELLYLRNRHCRGRKYEWKHGNK